MEKQIEDHSKENGIGQAQATAFKFVAFFEK